MSVEYPIVAPGTASIVARLDDPDRKGFLIATDGHSAFVRWADGVRECVPIAALETPQPPRPRMKDIATRVALSHGLTLRDLVGRSAKRRESWPRQESYAEMRKTGLFSYPQIGRFHGGRDHTTVIDGERRHYARLAAKTAAE